MKFVDSYVLARTKRRTRPVRTALVVIINSLLFALIFFAVFAVQGLIDTGRQVKDVGFNNRNLTAVYEANGQTIDGAALQDRLKAEMAAELRDQGIKVTEKTELDPTWQAELARRSNVAYAEFSERAAAELEADVTKVSNPKAFYHMSQLSALDGALAYQPDQSVDPLVESLKQSSGSDLAPNTFGYSAVFYNQVEQDFLQSQLAPGMDFSWRPGDPYPVVVSHTFIEDLAGESLANLSPAEENQRFRELLDEYTGVALDYCYRNSVAREQLNSVIQYNYKAERDDKQSTSPIDVPNCGGFDQDELEDLGVVAAADDSSDEPLFPQPERPTPITKRLQLRIVGFVPSQSPTRHTDIVSNLLVSTTSLPGSSKLVILPAEIVEQEPLFQPEGGPAYVFGLLFAEFATRDQERDFIAKSCTGAACFGSGQAALVVQPFGSVSFALEGVSRNAGKFVLISLGAIMVIAAIMLMFTISKVISDSTKEIAVFRSLGARRRDIAQIYYTYGAMLAAGSLALALAFSVAAALVATAVFGETIANLFIQGAGAYHTDVTTSLFSVNFTWAGLIAGGLLVSAFLGISIPIIVSIKRKLIVILREE